MAYSQVYSPVFRYAIISDTHIRPPMASSSPWKTNLLSNDRARWVAHAINNENPDLVIHLGDIVHPVPHLPTHGSASRVAQEIMSGLGAPYYFVPGNHDVGDKDNPTVPSHIVNMEFIEYFLSHIGPTYQSFEHKGIHFVIINSPVLNSGLPEESSQKQWLEEDFETHKNDRIHVFSHYSPYLHIPEEPSNYDNLDMPARGWLLRLIEKYRVEAFFAGHIHQFFYKRHLGTDIYNLLSTSNLRQDYSNMFKVEAPEEYGRNDVYKLGYCIVDVYKDGYATLIKRSYGNTLKEDEALLKETRVDEYYSSMYSVSPLGVQLRYPLAEITELPYMGPLDEFERKKARNDYTVLALWEAGVKTLRLPLADLTDDVTRQRLLELQSRGFKYGFFSVNIPEPSLLDEHRDLVDYVEVILPWENAKSKIIDAGRLRESLNLPVYVANIESSIHRKQTGPIFSHYLSYGFRRGDTEKLESVSSLRDVVDGFVFEVGQFDSPLTTVEHISEYANALGFKALVNIRLASEDPAEYPKDDNLAANRVAEAAVAAYAYPGVRVLLDTFMDHDRGYFPRVGLYDRLLNPRRASFVLHNMNSAFNAYGVKMSGVSKTVSANWTTIGFHSPQTIYSLKLPHSSKTPVMHLDSNVIDLTTGVINPRRLTPGSQHLVIEMA